MYRLEPALQTYAWGMSDVIETLLKRPVTGGPIAEAWWGAHPSAPAVALASHDAHADAVGLRPGDRSPLDELIARDPEAMLGPDVVARWERLPYLLKILAIAKPLSLQVHPTLAQADEGFRREETAGLAADDARRTFKDRSHKPEMIVAMTPMTVLVGFRRPKEVAVDLASLGVECARRWAEELSNATEPTVAMRRYIATVLHDPENADALAALAAAGGRPDAGVNLAVAAHALEEFPGDAGALVALALNVVRLEPGEACFTGAGVIHSYQSGVGVEVMANSDNVVRAGFTPKTVDVDLLVELTDGTPGPPPHVIPEREDAATVYAPPAAEFRLTKIDGGGGTFGSGPRVVLCLQGDARLTTGRRTLDIDAGESVFVPHADGSLRVDARGSTVVVEVPGSPG